MNDLSKPRVTQEYEKLKPEVQEQIKLAYPYGFSKHLIQFMNKEGKQVKGLRFEMEDKIYLIRMSVVEAEQIIEDDDDFDDNGLLKEDIKEDYSEKYADELAELADEEE